MEGDLRVYGIVILSFFSSVFSVIWILMCGIAVSVSPAVCGFSSFWTTVFGKEDPSRNCGIGYPPPPHPKFPSSCLLCLLLVIGTWQNGVQFTMVIYSCLSKIPQLRSCVLSFYHNCNRRLGRKGNNPKVNKKINIVLALWFEGNIVTDWKKAPNLPQMFRVGKTNLEGMPNDPIIRGGARQAFHFQHLL